MTLDRRIHTFACVVAAATCAVVALQLAPVVYLAASTRTVTGVASVSLYNSGAWGARVDVRVNESGTLSSLLDDAVRALKHARARHNVTSACVTMSGSDEIFAIPPYEEAEILGFAPGSNASACSGATRRAVVVETLTAVRGARISVAGWWGGFVDRPLLSNRVLVRFMAAVD